MYVLLRAKYDTALYAVYKFHWQGFKDGVGADFRLMY